MYYQVEQPKAKPGGINPSNRVHVTASFLNSFKISDMENNI